MRRHDAPQRGGQPRHDGARGGLGGVDQKVVALLRGRAGELGRGAGRVGPSSKTESATAHEAWEAVCCCSTSTHELAVAQGSSAGRQAVVTNPEWLAAYFPQRSCERATCLDSTNSQLHNPKTTSVFPTSLPTSAPPPRPHLHVSAVHAPAREVVLRRLHGERGWGGSDDGGVG